MTADVHRAAALAPVAHILDRLSAREVEPAAQLSVRVDGRVASTLGLATNPNTWSSFDDREALWLGPDEWLVVSANEPADAIARDLGSRVGLRHASFVDVSAARAVIELAGGGRHDVLAAGCGLDLHPRSWRPGMCAQTLVARVAVLLQERDDATRVFLRPSYGRYLVTWLARVAEDVPELPRRRSPRAPSS